MKAELGLELPEPEISAGEIEQLVGILREAAAHDERQIDPEKPRNGWRTGGELAVAMGEETSDRRVRKIASAAAPAVVSFPGSRGYKLWQACTVEEIAHCIESFESQASDMIKRARLYRQAYHRRFRGAPENLSPTP